MAGAGGLTGEQLILPILRGSIEVERRIGMPLICV